MCPDDTMLGDNVLLEAEADKALTCPHIQTNKHSDPSKFIQPISTASHPYQTSECGNSS